MVRWSINSEAEPTARRFGARVLRGRDDGFAMLELVVMMPFVIAMVLAVVALGRYAHGKQVTDQAATAAARAASLANTVNGAKDAAQQAAAEVLDNAGISCAPFHADADTSEFHPGGSVSVTVTCITTFSDLALKGLPGSKTLTVTASAPIENYRDLG